MLGPVKPTYEFFATVVKHVDGDTVDLMIDKGMRDFKKDRVRLYNMDAPERGQSGWAEANARIKELLPLETQVVIRSYKPNVGPHQDSFGRWIVEIFRDGVNINQQMIDEGHATVWKRS